MAQRTQVILTCDVHDGVADAVETVTFTVEGHSYECELCEPHLAEFRDAMEIWSSHSRAVGSGRNGRSARAGRRRGGSADGASTSEIRAWARAQGMQVSSRGRIPAELHAAYEAAH